MSNENNNGSITAEVGGTYELCPSGNYISHCCTMIVIGTIMESFEGRLPAPKKKVILGFETTNKKQVTEDGEEPFIIWQEYLLNLGKKANLRKMIENWAGQTYTDKEVEGLKLEKLVGKECMASVVEYKTGTGKERNKIQAITSVPDEVKVPSMFNKPLIFQYTNPFDTETFAKIPEWIQNKMKESTEYKQAVSGGITSSTQITSESTTTIAPKKKLF